MCARAAGLKLEHHILFGILSPGRKRSAERMILVPVTFTPFWYTEIHVQAAGPETKILQYFRRRIPRCQSIREMTERMSDSIRPDLNEEMRA